MNGFNAIFENDDRITEYSTQTALCTMRRAVVICLFNAENNSNAALGDGCGVMWNANCLINWNLVIPFVL